MNRVLATCPALLLSFLSCTKVDEGPTTSYLRQAITNWREDPNLSQEQKKALNALNDETRASGGVFSVQVWGKARAVFDLELTVPSGLPDRTPGEQALAFADKYGVLWNLRNTRLEVANEVNDGDCSSADLQLTRDGLPTVNAHLHFVIAAKGMVKRITGFMDGTPDTTEILPLRLDESAARRALAAGMHWGEEEAVDLLPRPVPVVFDQYFVSDRSHAPQYAWSFGAKGSFPTQRFLVNGQSGALLIGGPSFTYGDAIGKASVCESVADPAVAWQADVVVDPLTETPAWLSFKHFNGLLVDGNTLKDRVIGMMLKEPIARMFGDADPTTHLRLINETHIGNKAVLEFEQRLAGVRVEGAYLQVIFAGDRIREVFARLPYMPLYDDNGLIDQATASEHARAYYAGLRCGTDTSCIGHSRQDAKATEAVVFSSQLFDSPTLTGNYLTYKVSFEALVVWWDAKSDTVLHEMVPQSATIGATPTKVWSYLSTTAHRCLDPHDCKTVNADQIRPPEFKLDIDADGTEHPPLDAVSPSVREWMTQIDTTMTGQFRWTSIFGDGGVDQYNANANLDVVVGYTGEGGENAYAFTTIPGGMDVTPCVSG